MNKVIYVYSNHLDGGFYICDHQQTYDECYCEECRDSDWLEYEIKSEKDIEDFIELNTKDYCNDCQKLFTPTDDDKCPYCSGKNISYQGSVTDPEYIMEFAQELREWIQEETTNVVIEDFISNENKYHFNKQIQLNVKQEPQIAKYYYYDHVFDVFGYVDKLEDVEKEYQEDFVELYEAYALEDDCNLDNSARKLKRKFLSYCTIIPIKKATKEEQ